MTTRGSVWTFPVLCLVIILPVVYCSQWPCAMNHHGAEVFANCSHRQLTSFPVTWPTNITKIDVSYNDISTLSTQAMVLPNTVRHFDISHNKLSVLDLYPFNRSHFLESMDLSYNQLASIHIDTFSQAPNLKVLKLDHNDLSSTIAAETLAKLSSLQQLDLSHNHLTDLANGTFRELRHLTWLNLQYNHLQNLKPGLWTGLSKLAFLDLSHNKLVMVSSVYPPHVFASLTSLRELHLERNDDREMGEYPTGMFGGLTVLRYLSLDTFSTTHFGQDFAATLHQIETLDLEQGCKIRRLFNDSFEGFHFSSLTHIRLSFCPLFDIETCAFCNLPNLKTLKVKNSDRLAVNIALKSLYGLQNQTMTRIEFSYIGVLLFTLYTIDKSSSKYLQNICVSTLSLKDSHIQRLKSGCFGRHSVFLQCVETIDVSNNQIYADGGTLLQVMIFAKKLRVLELQKQSIFSLDKSASMLSEKYYKNSDNPSLDTDFVSFTVPTPSTLNVLNLSSVITNLKPLPRYLNFSSAEQLHTLDLSYTGLGHCLTTLIGLRHLRKLNLNFNNCYKISESFFDYLPSLEHLELSNFGVEHSFYVFRGHRMFRNLTSLKSVIMSLNQLTHVDRDMFRAQKNLTKLDLSKNRFQEIPVNLLYHQELSELDMSRNTIPSLTVAERQALDDLSSHRQVIVRLVGNPLTCTCANLDLVRWLWSTSVTLDGEGQAGKYTCTTEKGEITNTRRVMDNWVFHWRRCVGIWWFGLTLGLFFMQMLGLAVTYIISRTWTLLCYKWKAVRHHRLPQRLRDFTRDVYFVYADRDIPWACQILPPRLQHGDRPLRILLRNWEEPAGANKADCIAQHIEMSWKTLFLVTRDLTEDEWAWFAVKQAIRYINDLTPDRAIVVFLEDPKTLPAMDCLEMLLRLVPERNVFYVRKNTPARHRVWKTLYDCIVGGGGGEGR